MAATFGGAVSEAAPVLVDETASQGTGAVCSGIGLAGTADADGDALANSRIGGDAVNFTVETDGNLATPI